MKVKKAGKLKLYVIALGSCKLLSSWLLSGSSKALKKRAGVLNNSRKQEAGKRAGSPFLKGLKTGAGVLNVLKKRATSQAVATGRGNQQGNSRAGVLLRLLRSGQQVATGNGNGGAYYRQQQGQQLKQGNSSTAQTTAGNRGGQALNILNNSGQAVAIAQTGATGQAGNSNGGRLQCAYYSRAFLIFLRKLLGKGKENKGEKQQRAGVGVQKSLFYKGFSGSDAIAGRYYCNNTAGVHVLGACLSKALQGKGKQGQGGQAGRAGGRKTGGTLGRNLPLGGGDYRKSVPFLHFWAGSRSTANTMLFINVFLCSYKGFGVVQNAYS